MKTVESTRVVKIPANVKAVVKARSVSVTGPRGTLKRNFKHLNFDMRLEGKKNQKIVVSVYFANRAELASLRTVTSHIENMITGVLKGYEYKMRLVYAHFPINVNIADSGTLLEIRNFLGEKNVRKVPMLAGVKVDRTNVKDELVLIGNDVELVSQSAASIHQSTKVPEKDIRKFLDGIYVSSKKVLGED